MHATLDAGASPMSSDQYWRGIFTRNRDFCSWQTPKQRRVRQVVCECLSEPAGRVRVLDFGVGSMGLYRSLDDDLMRRIRLTGISESPQHDADDPWFARHPIAIAIGPGVSPLAQVPAASQDRVVCTYVFDYLSDEARSDALRAFANVMDDEAKLLLVLHHPRGQRADKFRRSRPLWPMARALYARLLAGRYAEARTLLDELDARLDATFAHDAQYLGYLASYLKTARVFLSEFYGDGRLIHPIPEAARLACERTARAIDREQAMTCEALRPVEHPATDLALPRELSLSTVAECADPTNGAPMAYVLTIVRGRHAQNP